MSIRLEKGAQRTWLLPLLLVLIGVAVRLWQLGGMPCGLNQDEAYAGYEAYSMLTYGVDSWGYTNPCYFISWGRRMANSVRPSRATKGMARQLSSTFMPLPQEIK